MSEKLRKCPFCGKDDVSRCDRHGEIKEDSGDYVGCNRTSDCMPFETVIPLNLWQKRPIEDALLAAITEIRKLATPPEDLAEHEQQYAMAIRLEMIRSRADAALPATPLPASERADQEAA